MKGKEGTIRLIVYPGSWSGRSECEDIKKNRTIKTTSFCCFFLPLGVCRPSATGQECNVLLQLPRHHSTRFPTLGKFGADAFTCMLEAVPLVTVGVFQETTWGGKCLLRRTDRKLKPGGARAMGRQWLVETRKLAKRPVLRH